MKARSLKELKKLRQQFAAAQAQAAKEAQAAQTRQQAQARQRQSDHALFLRAIGAVQPLKASARHEKAGQAARPAPLPRQRQQDERAALRETLSDEFDASTLLHVDEHLSYLRAGIGPDVPARLRRGQWAVQRQIDLHGLRVDQARQALAAFIAAACRSGVRCVRVVHGKGHGSPGKTSVLRAKVPGWLIQKHEVLAFVQARPPDGGAGALLVLLRAA
ncbi:Smr/MutS family protein [Ottowia cancrivicina]|jgi:smr protein/mutS2|uniref:Smr/MutS family protein n=1 Tax=Ottowia cancrivicina TaxID=3040346 RepID=A0AAW6RMU1_9BURK|nr:Smr/MutS family protein [Ottowia sp. 10c7w1]MDG9699633.1 Smr/MutS family protein [Ottowia sp. 10c7w1]